MKYLLDSHIFLWSLMEPSRLSEKVSRILIDPDNRIYISAITFWEISLKYGLGKLTLNGVSPDQLPAYALQTGFDLLPLSPEESAGYHQLEASWHRDPFDRMLIFQAIQNGITLISKDDHIARYQSVGLKVIW